MIRSRIRVGENDGHWNEKRGDPALLTEELI
jgi:hypothetical protein